MRYTAPRYILVFSYYFLCVGLCSRLRSSLQDTWQNSGRRMQSYQLRHVDRVDLGPCDHHQVTCVKRDLSERNRRLTLRLVASQGDSDQDRTDELSGERGRVVRLWGDKWRHPDSPMKIRLAPFTRSWDPGPRSLRDRGRQSVFTESDGLRFL